MAHISCFFPHIGKNEYLYNQIIFIRYIHRIMSSASIVTATTKVVVASDSIMRAMTPPRRVYDIDKSSKPKENTVTFIPAHLYVVKPGTKSVLRVAGIVLGARDPINIPMSFGASIYGISDKSGDARSSLIHNAKTAIISIDLASLSEMDRTALEIIDRDYVECARDPANKRYYPRGDTMPITSFISRNYGTIGVAIEKRGLPRDNPLVRFAVHFDTFPMEFKPLAGVPKTRVYEWSTQRAVDGEIVFDERVDDKGATLRSDNCEAILPQGDIIKRVELQIDAFSISDKGSSLRASVFKIWVERNKSSNNYIDDDDITTPPAAAAAAAPVSDYASESDEEATESIYDRDE